MIVTARTDYTAAGRSQPPRILPETSWTTVLRLVALATPFFSPGVMWSIDWNGGYSCNRPPSATLPTWAGCGAVFKSPSPSPSRPEDHIACLVAHCSAFTRTVPNRFLSGIGTCYVELVSRNVTADRAKCLYAVPGGAGVPAGDIGMMV